MKIKEDHEWSNPVNRLTFQVRKVVGGWPRKLYCQSQSHSLFPWDFRLGTYKDLALGQKIGLSNKFAKAAGLKE